MNKAFLPVVLLLFILACNRPDPVAYNKTIIDEQTKVLSAMDSVNYTILAADAAGIKTALQRASTQCNISIKVIESLGPFEGDDEYRQAALRVFNYYKSTTDTKFKQVVAIFELDEPTDENIDKVESIMSEFEINIDSLDNIAIKAQANFATKHHLELE